MYSVFNIHTHFVRCIQFHFYYMYNDIPYLRLSSHCMNTSADVLKSKFTTTRFKCSILLKPVLEGVDVSLHLHYRSWTGSIKPNLPHFTILLLFHGFYFLSLVLLNITFIFVHSVFSILLIRNIIALNLI